jgi:hypothetical protein
MIFILRSTLVAMLLLAAAACGRELAAPAVPLALSVTVRSIDGSPLPAGIAERPGAIDFVAQYSFRLERDGSWSSSGVYNPAGAEPTTGTNFWDNGSYRYDGQTLVFHSNFSHTDWPATVRGDTISATILFPIANSTHAVVMW